VVRHTGRLVRGSGIFEVIPVGEEAEFRWTEELELPLSPALGRMAGLAIKPMAEAALAASLRRFARLF
jgi:hypothetical protein